MDIQKMDETDKLNFIVRALVNKPELIDQILEKVASELNEPYRMNLYNLVMATTKGYMAKMEKYFDAKDNTAPGEALLSAINHACSFNCLIPYWARRAFSDSWGSYRSYEVKTFSGAFKLEERRNIAQRRKNWMIKHLVWGEVIRLHRHDRERWPKDKRTFEHIGKKYGVSGSAAEKLFYSVEPKRKKQKISKN